ncbi:hypothetical protein HC776_00415 [bacterium]|nr:hypothetical protein [bacterium]
MEPTFNDYVSLLYNRFEAFVQASATVKEIGRPFVYQHKSLIVFFLWMQFKRIYQFKTQWRWLGQHPEALGVLNWEQIPHRTTLSRRYKHLAAVIEEFVLFVAQTSEPLDERTHTRHLYEDKSLFKASGPVWHQADRQQGRIPSKLRHLDVDATWSKSAYHGWVYGYGLHLTCNQAGFPVMIAVDTAACAERAAVDHKEEVLLQRLKPDTFCGDNAYTQAKRIRRWAACGVILLTPALRWRTGRYAQAYQRFIQQADIAALLRRRKTAIEPVFDLIGKLLGVTGKQKQLAFQRLGNVRTGLSLAVLSLQIAMLANSVWGLPFRSISTIKGAFA